MNGNTGIQPTVELATTNGNGYGYPYPVMPFYAGNGYGNGGFFGGSDGIWGIILLALLFNNGWGGFGGNNGFNNLATTDFVSSEFTQRDISQLSNTVTNGFQNQSNLISGGFADNAQNICNLRSDVLTGNMGLQNSILSSSCNTQRDILTQTNELNTNLLRAELEGQMTASNNALTNLAKQEECCCRLETGALRNTQSIIDTVRSEGDATRALITQNTIDTLREKLNEANTEISNRNIESSIINSIRPYPTPSWLVSSPYQSIYNPYNFGWNNGGFYGNGFFGNTIV